MTRLHHRAVLLAGLLLGAGCFTQAEEPDADAYLPSGDWVVSGHRAAELYSEGALVLDTRSWEAHQSGHVAGAVYATWQEFSEPEDPYRGRLLGDATELADRIESLGVSRHVPVVVVGQPLGGWGEDGRIVWMLRTLGHPSASLVDGGMHALDAAGLPMTTEPTPTAPRGTFPVERIVDHDIQRDTLQALVTAGGPDASTLR